MYLMNRGRMDLEPFRAKGLCRDPDFPPNGRTISGLPEAPE